jgi:cobalt/nickel transport system permease protein
MLYSPIAVPVHAPAYMHIPDGYLSPITCLVLFLLVLPFWYRGIQRMRQTMNARSVPLIALLAAFSFIIMMFNVPLPGGTTGHAVGGALVAIILGPEIAVIPISIALIIQALFFGDGGILSIGADCFNMAVVLPYVSYAIYKWFGGLQAVSTSRRTIAAFLAGWVGLTVASFFAAVEFGIQPALFHAADGTPLYAPYPLAIAIPAMVIPHMLVASVVEGLITALVVAYLTRSNPALLQISTEPQAAGGVSTWRRLRWLWIGLIVLALLAPIGLLARGTAWGEWGSQELAQQPGVNTVPQGLQALESLWSAPLAGYDAPQLGNSSAGYILSAVVGVVLVTIVVWLFAQLLLSRKPTVKPPASSQP